MLRNHNESSVIHAQPIIVRYYIYIYRAGDRHAGCCSARRRRNARRRAQQYLRIGAGNPAGSPHRAARRLRAGHHAARGRVAARVCAQPGAHYAAGVHRPQSCSTAVGGGARPAVHAQPALLAACVFGPACLLPVYRRHLNGAADERLRA